MKIIIIANHNRGHFSPFVTEQAQALKRAGVEVVWFGMEGHGIIGYLSNHPRLLKIIREEKPEIIHAHYGYCGTLACLQRRVPVVTTYHGTDINNPSVRRISRVALCLSQCNIFVSAQLKEVAGPCCRRAVVQPCGVDLDIFPETDRGEARRRMDLDPLKRYVLFASAFDNPVKNAALAREAMQHFPEAELLELKGYSRPEVAWLLQAVDCLLMTSDKEGSPQVVKEALACGTPIVSVPVGDVAWLTEGVDGCWLAERNPDDIAAKIQSALDFKGKTRGRERLESIGLDNTQVAARLVSLYKKVKGKK